MKIKNIYLAIVVLVLLGLVIFFTISEKAAAPAGSMSNKMGMMANNPIPAGYNAPVTNTTAPVKEFTVTGQNFSFSPNVLNVNKGDVVKINFKDANGFHDLRLDDFKVSTERLQTGGEATVTFVASKAGSFQYYCSVGTHRAMGMWGTLNVK